MSTPQSLALAKVDFVSDDFDALASHMRHCASAHGRWFAVRSGLQRMRSMAAGRIVTMACLAVLIGIGLSAVT
ncbi:MAG: hypothetical protein EOP82_22425 [Variovorax sp.]|nr:MAG: hypothetical protein EOP82_22425 [Variovorax sp.]